MRQLIVAGFAICTLGLVGCSTLSTGAGTHLLPGTRFGLQPFAGGRGTPAFSVLFGFDNRLGDGIQPNAALVSVSGILYGTTLIGGVNNGGTVFSIDANGQETVLHSFGAGADGRFPTADLLNVNGVLYGTTTNGGQHCYGSSPGCGTVFSITTAGAEKVLFSFEGGRKGHAPYAGLASLNGILYGTTVVGGANGAGMIFAMSLNGAERVIHSFNPSTDGSNCTSDLVALGGSLYGTCGAGGANHYGTVFAVTPSGKFKTLHAFPSGNDEAGLPSGPLLFSNGEFFGTTQDAGGAVYAITPSGSERVVYRFDGQLPGEGAGPLGGLVSFRGNLFGTTYYGGTSGFGTVFSLTKSGQVQVLHSFGFPDGIYPPAGLTVMGEKLYGVTSFGGPTSGSGTIFDVTP